MYEEIVESGGCTCAAFDLCTLVTHSMWAGAGLYRVDSIQSYPSGDPGHTYIQFTLMTPWFSAPEAPLARINGDDLSNGVRTGDLSLKVGETVGVFLMRPGDYSNGYYSLHPIGIFHSSPSGGYTNGMLFTKTVVDATKLGDLVKGLVGSQPASCPYNVEPDTETVADSGMVPAETRVPGPVAGHQDAAAP